MAGVWRGTRTVATWLMPVAAVALALAVVAAQLADRASVSVQQCVAGGGLARVGLGLALLRADEACPRGELALGGDQRQVIGVVVLVALPVLAGHVLGAAAGVGVVARLHRLLRVVLAMLIPSLRAPQAQPAWEPARFVASRPVDRPVTGVVLGVPQRRGPPQVRFV